MKFGLSQGMVLAASGDDGPGVYLLEPDSGADARHESDVTARHRRSSHRRPAAADAMHALRLRRLQALCGSHRER